MSAFVAAAAVLSGCATLPGDGGEADRLATGPRGANAAGGPAILLADANVWTQDIRVSLQDRGPFRFARAEVAGQPAGVFLLDTGANRTVIANGVAGRLNLENLGEVRASGVTGWSTHRRTRLPGLSLWGEAIEPGFTTTDEREDPRGSSVELGPREALGLSFHRLGPGLRGGVGGILAFTDLAAVPFTIAPASGDRPASLTLHRPRAFRPPPNATRHRLRLVQGLPVVEASVNGARGKPALPVDLLLDTGGSGALSLPLETLSLRPDLASVPVSGAGVRLGVGGPGGVTETWVRSLTTLGLTLRDVPTAFGPSPPGLAARPGRTLGRLGQGVLGQARLTFDAPRGWLYVEFSPP